MTTSGQDQLEAAAQLYEQYRELTEVTDVAQIAAMMQEPPEGTWAGAPPVGLVVTG